MKDWLPKAMFLVALCGVSFAYGFVSNWKQIFPYRIIDEAYIAFKALVQLEEEKSDLPKGVIFWDDEGSGAPVVSRKAAAAGEELIFGLGSGPGYFNLNTESGFGAWIADRSGKVLHAWKDFGDVWADEANREAVSGSWITYPVGAHVYPNGDLLVSFQGGSVFPFAMGMAKFDKDSNLLWKNSDYLHHWFSVDDDGQIFVSGLIKTDAKTDLDDRYNGFICDRGPFYYDSIVVLDEQGNKTREIDMVEALNNSDLVGLFGHKDGVPNSLETCDPTHLNDIRILSEAQATEYPLFDAGDLLLSFRELNTIAVMDPNTALIKWSYTGASHSQHSPRFRGQNQILMFDNLGGLVSRGTSRVLSVDVGSHRARPVFPRPDTDLPEYEILSATAGHIDISPDGERVLVAWAHAGVITEIDIDRGELLWEWINDHTYGENKGRMTVYTAKYLPDPGFQMNGGQLQ